MATQQRLAVFLVITRMATQRRLAVFLVITMNGDPMAADRIFVGCAFMRTVR
ncbi:hypothetical protein [Pantoea sp. VS1]|uniref:hypothetical protein n=1 Tax=Pantoea sp. VS1 TaxID=2003658 RepID=UPI00159584C3|nr:hypothetical protein [Pantoea sp. VS1]